MHGMNTCSESDNRSTDEVAAAIRDILKSEEKLKSLRDKAKKACRNYRLPHMDEDDLIGKTVAQILGDSRKCPRSMEVWVHLIVSLTRVAMDAKRSAARWAASSTAAASKAREQNSQLGVRRPPCHSDDPGEGMQLGLHSDHATSPERQHRVNRALDQVLALFDDDTSAQSWVRYVALGYEGHELKERLGLDARGLDATRKRVARRLVKHYPNGLDDLC